MSRRNKQKTNAKTTPVFSSAHLVFQKWLSKNIWNKIITILCLLVMFSIGSMYGIAQWYMYRHADEPLRLGASFVPDYAVNLGVDPVTTMDALINDLGVKRLRLVSYWENGEAVQGTYDFSFLDWQFKKAENAGVKVSLAIGLRQPRWPECHMPTWATKMPKSDWEPRLKNYIYEVVNRYKDSPALDSYQLENEYFLKAFGICPDFSRDRLVDEYNLVKKADPNHTLIVSMSNNAIGTPIGNPTPDMWAISVYKRVWDRTITKRYFEYPLPAWYYGFRAGWTEITRGHDSFIHELQAEAWTPDGYDIRTAPVSELYKSLNPERLTNRFEYGRATGMHTIDLWGVEWWYQMKVVRGQPELWNTAKKEFAKSPDLL
ncbi:hypothetical protein HY003_03485 [Candidatus Saccharibacteria bacterium]|nr:hypothetical protein [Candidatus Saccharibacteria bacterium]MBI3338336.1 hypothetical protein [Candidatus Saccharibacteria bacterium]